jgi:hypothetical protein
MLTEEGRWQLHDGNPDGQTGSTNGTWVYLDMAMPAFDGMLFHSCNYLF